MSARRSFSTCAHSSTAYTYQNKLPLRQSLYLGVPVGLTKHLCAGTCIACRRMCKGYDLDDGLLMPKLSKIGDLAPNARARKTRIFGTAVGPKIEKKKRYIKILILDPLTPFVPYLIHFRIINNPY